MRQTFFLVVFLWLCTFSAKAQGYVGFNAAPLTGRCLEGYFMAQPKNMDWLNLAAGGGYCLKGPNFLRIFPKDDLQEVRHGGYHGFVMIRNAFTTDHHEKHLWWGVKFCLSRVNEWGYNTAIHQSVEAHNWVTGISVMAGYSLVLNKQGIDNKLYFDFGAQVGFRLHETGPLLQQGMNYIPGLGYGRTGTDRGFNLDLIAGLRYELWHGRFGYSKPSGY